MKKITDRIEKAKQRGATVSVALLMTIALEDGVLVHADVFATSNVRGETSCAGNGCAAPVDFQRAHAKKTVKRTVVVPNGFRLKKNATHHAECDVAELMGDATVVATAKRRQPGAPLVEFGSSQIRGTAQDRPVRIDWNAPAAISPVVEARPSPTAVIGVEMRLAKGGRGGTSGSRTRHFRNALQIERERALIERAADPIQAARAVTLVVDPRRPEKRWIDFFFNWHASPTRRLELIVEAIAREGAAGGMAFVARIVGLPVRSGAVWHVQAAPTSIGEKRRIRLFVASGDESVARNLRVGHGYLFASPTLTHRRRHTAGIDQDDVIVHVGHPDWIVETDAPLSHDEAVERRKKIHPAAQA